MIVKIDRSTIRKNPNAGNTVYYRNIGPKEYHKQTITFEDGIWYKRVQIGYSYSEEKIVWTLSHEESIKQEKRPDHFYPDFKESSYQPTEKLYSLSPEPEYLFKYENTVISCEYCNEEFPTNELMNDFDDYSGYNDRVCPKCSAWDCCEIQYEVFDPKSINEKSPIDN